MSRKVGDEGFKKAPIGAGPYKFVSFNPGVELVLEAFDGYWRKTPSVKRLVMKVIPDESTRLAALKGGEVDIAYSIRGDLAEELQATPGMTLKSVVTAGDELDLFPGAMGPEIAVAQISRCGRPPISRSIATAGMTRCFSADARLITALSQRRSSVTGSHPKRVYDPAKARKLLAEAGYPNGFDAGPFWVDGSYSNIGEVAVNSLQQIGIRTNLQPIERAAFLQAYASKKLNKGIFRAASGAFGNAATRLASFVVKDGAFVYGSYPDIDELFPKQAANSISKKREEILHKMQQLVYEKAMSAPIWELVFISGVGPRLGESSFGKIAGFPYTAPFEDLTIQKA